MNLLTASETAKWLDLHIKTIHRLARTGKIPCYRFGKMWMFNREEILRTGRRPPQ